MEKESISLHSTSKKTSLQKTFLNTQLKNGKGREGTTSNHSTEVSMLV